MAELNEIVSSLEEKRQEHLQKAEAIGAAINVLTESEDKPHKKRRRSLTFPAKVNGVEAQVVLTGDDRAEEPREAPPLTEESRRAILHVLTRLGRLCYAPQIVEEMLRDGRDMPADALATMAADKQICKVRFNNSNLCLTYGLPSWVDPLREKIILNDDFFPLGKNITPKSAEIL